MDGSRLRQLHDHMVMKTYKHGESIWRQGDEATTVSWLQSGEVSLSREVRITHSTRCPIDLSHWKVEQSTGLWSCTVKTLQQKHTLGAEAIKGKDAHTHAPAKREFSAVCTSEGGCTVLSLRKRDFRFLSEDQVENVQASLQVCVIFMD